MSAPANTPPPRFVRLAEAHRPALAITIDGVPCTALEGDTLLVALLCNGRRVRDSEFGDGPRAGFCLMSACQDCWVWTPEGHRLRACSTTAVAGMSVLTRPPAQHWPVTQDLIDTLKRHGKPLPTRATDTAGDAA
jgi:D-hydroxyproline dehydrogenase subunit gamma